MPVLSGLNQQFVFASITYGPSACVQSAGINTSLNAPTYQCSGIMKNTIGAKTFSFTYSIAVSATNDSYVTALDVGSTSTLSYFPFATTTGYLKLTSTRGVCTQQNISSAANGVVTVDGTIALDDLTYGTSTGG